MLENLRKKSLVKTYNDPTHQVHFEQGVVRYGSYVEIDVCTQRLSKKLQKMSFQKAIDTISIDIGVWFRFNMIYCPKGTFTMGSIDQTNNPPRLETIDRPFLLGETEITQELYEKVMNTNPSNSKNPKNPIERVSWYDAILFCNAFSRLQGLDECYTKNEASLDYGWDCDFSKNGYRLPEEKEWEYAAKAGTDNLYAGTDNIEKLGEYAWFWDNSKIGRTYQIHPVATKLPNEWGFYDMSGNVDEWCWDKYDPKGKATDPRVSRGGSWFSKAAGLRSVGRRSYLPNHTNIDLGFRVCRSVVN